MSEEKSLGDIAYEASMRPAIGISKYWYWENIASAVEKEVLKRKKKSDEDPDDPTTWEDGVDLFARDYKNEHWVYVKFVSYDKNGNYPYLTFSTTRREQRYKYAKLATPEQIEAWKLINGDL